jgi:hypothetical protein
MTGKKTLIAVFTALGLALVSVGSVQANTNSMGGSKVGPLGQRMGGPSGWGARGFPHAAYRAHAFVPYHAHKHAHIRVR